MKSELMNNFVFKLYTWFVTPVFTSTILISIISLFSKDKNYKFLVFLGIIDLLLVTFSFGGRYAIVRAMIFLVSVFLFGRKYMGIERSTFILGKDGKIEKEWRKVKVKGHVDEVIEYLKK